MTTPSEPLYTDTVSFALIRSRGKDDYFASSDGDVYRIRKISPSLNRGGYLVAGVFDADGVYRPKTVHSIIAEAFIGPRPDGLVINHIDGNKVNNRVDNLEYITEGDNVRHAVRLGLRKVTEETRERLRQIGKHNNRKRTLSDDKIVELVKLYISGGKTMKEVGEAFGITQSTVCLAVNRKGAYKDIPACIDPSPSRYWRRKLTDDQIDTIIEAYSTGQFMMKELAQQYSVTTGTISLVIRKYRDILLSKRNGVPIRRGHFGKNKRKLSDEQIPEMAGLRANGHSVVALAKQYSVSTALIYQAVRKEKARLDSTIS